MDSKTALNILVNAVQLANTKGAYTLSDAKTIQEAVEVFMAKPTTAPEAPKKEEKKK